MEQKKYKRYTVTSALPYANGGVHIGHLAGVYVPADIYVRYLHAKKREVMFIGGSDEHGVPITIRARKEGITPQQVVNRYHAMIRDSFEDFGISFDVYSRTTSKTHHQFAADFFRKLYDEGKLTEEMTTQLYDEEAKQFLADRYVTGECPHCHNQGAYGDQCEKCGRDLSPTELINPKSTISGTTPVLKETKNWYLPLNEYQEWLKQWILEGHKEWRPNVYGQCKSWLDMDLQPRAMTRDLDWGIPVPVEGAEGKVLYVWFDAPIGYISNTKELCESDPQRWGSWQKWWQDEDTRLVHFIGKDNIVFHCIIFPTMMKAWNEANAIHPPKGGTRGAYIMPDNVPANEFLNLENDKISTSRNWAVWLHEYLEDFPGKQDVLRYVLTANAPETKDNNFTWKDFQDRNNNELVAIYGNFVNRALQLTQKYWGGVVPARGELLDVDKQAIEEFKNVKTKIEDLLEQFKFRDAQFEAMNLARIGNRYITECEPWKEWKASPNPSKGGENCPPSPNPSEAGEWLHGEKRVQTVLNICLQIVANLSIAFGPFLPFSSNRLRSLINTNDLDWEQLGGIDLLPAGHQLNEPQLLFEKIDDEAIKRQLDKLEATKKANEASSSAAPAASSPASPAAPAPAAPAAAQSVADGFPIGIKPNVPFEDFEKLDIRVGVVKDCQPVKKSKKLLQFTIDDGTGTDRTICSGIAQFYENPAELIGRRILFVANFAPRKMMGIESQGMILSAVDADESLSVVTTTKDVRPGSQVG